MELKLCQGTMGDGQPVMTALLLLTTLAFGASTPRYPGATLITQFDFRFSPEGDFNKPEGWTRYEADDYPFYVKAELTTEESAIKGRSLVFRLNGGNCALFSPKVEASEDYNYVVRGQIKTKGLQYDTALILLEFLDADGKLLDQQQLSPRVGGTSDWTMVEIGPVAPRDPNVRQLRVACLSQTGAESDLQGNVYFDDLIVGRLPRFEVKTSSPNRLFNVEVPKTLSLAIRGTENRQLQARFTLLDEARNPLAEASVPIDSQQGKANAEWVIPADRVGFYHLEVTLDEPNRSILKRDFPLTVARSLTPAENGDFGLSLPAIDGQYDRYSHLLEYAGTRWIKVPLWSLDASTLLDDFAMADFLERMSRRGHEIVGGLEGAPVGIRQHLADEDVGIADLFSLPENLWAGPLENLLVRYSLKVQHWQIGSDRDRSIQFLTNPISLRERIESQTSRLGRDVKFGFSWDWMVESPADRSIDFVSFSDAPPEGTFGHLYGWEPLSASELAASIRERRATWAGASQTNPAPNESPQTLMWATITPASQSRYERNERIADLAHRAVAAKANGVDALFLTDLDDPDHGVFDEEGSPRELFTIWRTLAEHLSGMKYLGVLPVVGECENRFFNGRGKVTIVLWSKQPSSVEAVLGPQARVIDLWGREVIGTSSQEPHVIQTGPMPVLVIDADEFLTRFQMNVRFAKAIVPSQFGSHADHLVVSNPGSTNLTGSAIPHFPREWNQRPAQILLQLVPGEESQSPFLITLPQGTSQRQHTIPIEFTLTGERGYRFTIYRPFRVGGDEIKVDTMSRILPNGLLSLEATVTNLTTDRLSLNASARSLGKKAKTDFIPNLAPGSTATAKFLFENGETFRGVPMQLKFDDFSGRREFTFDVTIDP